MSLRPKARSSKLEPNITEPELPTAKPAESQQKMAAHLLKLRVLEAQVNGGFWQQYREETY